MDCFKAFYADTALGGGRIGTVCGPGILRRRSCAFRLGRAVRRRGRSGYIRETMKVIASLDSAQADKEKICYRNAQALFKL